LQPIFADISVLFAFQSSLFSFNSENRHKKQHNALKKCEKEKNRTVHKLQTRKRRVF